MEFLDFLEEESNHTYKPDECKSKFKKKVITLTNLMNVSLNLKLKIFLMTTGILFLKTILILTLDLLSMKKLKR